MTENIVRRGRNSGIGITLITQRPAVLNKDVLTQVDALCVMRMLGPQDRNAIDDWVGEHGDTKLGREVKESLPALATGECWWWVPELGILKRVNVRASRTFDSSPTRKRGQEGREPRSYADVDMDAIERKMAETIERAKENDPRELRRRIAELERELAKKPAAATVEERLVEKVIEVPALDEKQLAELQTSLRAVDELGRTLASAIAAGQQTIEKETATIVTHLRTVIERSSDGARPHPEATRAAPPRAARDQRAPRRDLEHTRRPAPRPERDLRPPATEDGFTPSGPQQRILNALAALQTFGVEPANRTQLALFAEASPSSSSYTNNLGELRTNGLIDYPAPARVALTDAGAAIADSAEAPTTVEELHAYVARLVGGAKWRLLSVLIEEGGQAIPKAELAERAGVSATSSSFTNNLGSLRSLGLVDYPSPGWVMAGPVLFLES